MYQGFQNRPRKLLGLFLCCICYCDGEVGEVCEVVAALHFPDCESWVNQRKPCQKIFFEFTYCSLGYINSMNILWCKLVFKFIFQDGLYDDVSRLIVPHIYFQIDTFRQKYLIKLNLSIFNFCGIYTFQCSQKDITAIVII